MFWRNRSELLDRDGITAVVEVGESFCSRLGISQARIYVRACQLMRAPFFLCRLEASSRALWIVGTSNEAIEKPHRRLENDTRRAPGTSRSEYEAKDDDVDDADDMMPRGIADFKLSCQRQYEKISALGGILPKQ